MENTAVPVSIPPKRSVQVLDNPGNSLHAAGHGMPAQRKTSIEMAIDRDDGVAVYFLRSESDLVQIAPTLNPGAHPQAQ